MGEFSFFVFMNPWASIVDFWIAFCLGKDFLFKSSLAGCVQLFSSIHKILSDISQQGAYSRELIGLHNINTFEVIILKSGHMFI